MENSAEVKEEKGKLPLQNVKDCVSFMERLELRN